MQKFWAFGNDIEQQELLFNELKRFARLPARCRCAGLFKWSVWPYFVSALRGAGLTIGFSFIVYCEYTQDFIYKGDIR